MGKSIFFDKGPNCFGYLRYSPLIVFANDYSELLEKIRRDAIKYLFADKSQMFDEIEKVCRNEIEKDSLQLTSFDLELKVENKIHYSQNQNGFIQNRLRERCYRIKEQLLACLNDLQLQFTPSDKLLDVGAGSGLIAQLMKHELELNYALLTDVVDYRYPEIRNSRGIDFCIFKAPFNHIETDKNFQLGIITNTLHHCDHPFDVFSTLTERLDSGAILMVIESCIGVSPEDIAKFSYSSLIPYQTLYNHSGETKEDQIEYLILSNEHKMIYGIFFDWLYNRVFLNENINVPYNFGNPHDWNRCFEAKGFEVLKTYLMGFDQPAALEFHTLHILKKS